MPADAPNSPTPPEGVPPRLAVGRYVLVLGDQGGTAIESGSGEDSPHELVQALAARPDEHRPSADAPLKSTLEEASQATEKAERALSLFTEIAEGRLDPTSINDELNALLGLLGRLDRDEHFTQALELARSLAMLLALLRRWVELLQSLKIALAAAERIGDEGGRAWALHELGTLHLAAERYAEGDRLLEQARSLREQIGDRRSLALTERNLQVLCRALRARLHQPPRPSAIAQILRRPILAVPLALALLLAGGVAGAEIRGSASSGGPTSRSAAMTAANQTSGITPTPTHTIPPPPSPGPATHTLSLIGRGTGSGTLTSSDGSLLCKAACSHTYSSTATLALSATPAAGSVFTGWIGDCSGQSTCRLRMSEDRHVTGVFTLAPLTLSLSTTGTGKGTIRSADGQINCSEACTTTYPPGSQITLTAIPAEGSRFTGWGGACSGLETCQLTLNASEPVTADFTVALG